MIRSARHLSASALLAAAFVPLPASAEAGRVAPSIAVGAEGNSLLVQYATDGSEIRRFTGLLGVTALALHDRSTVLIAERGRNRIMALTLEGQIAWEIPALRPRCVRPLAADRFLVCQDDPPALVEIDRAGNEVWRLHEPPADVAGAARLPDGNVAVAVGRHPDVGVHVFDRDGKRLWTWPQRVDQPQGLALLPTGEIAASGHDRGDVAIIRPYTSETRFLNFCCRPFKLSDTDDGWLVAAGWLTQRVRGWLPNGKLAWDFKTRYPPGASLLLPDGSVLVALAIEPDARCLNARAAAARATRPLAAYWIWLFAGTGLAAVSVVLLQYPVLRSHLLAWRTEGARRDGSRTGTGPPPPSVRRRVEIGTYVTLGVAFTAAAAVHLQHLLSVNQIRLWPYAGLVAAAGFCLALVQARTPARVGEWAARMRSLESMARPTVRMWILWLAGTGLLAAALRWILKDRLDWAVGAWGGALVLLAGGAVERRPPAVGRRTVAAVVCLTLFAAVAFARVFRLEDYPANLHNDMAEWTKHTIRLIDGQFPTLFGHGYADIPLVGHLWSALWTALAGRSLSGARFASVTGSLLAIWGVYLLARRLYGPVAAAAAVVCLGANHAFLHFSRIQHYMDPVPFHVLGVLGLLAGLETGRYAWFALAGLAGGYSALTYHSGRVTPIVLLLLALLVVLRYPRSLIRRWPGLLLSALTFLAMVGPYAALFWTRRLHAFGRSEVYPFVVDNRFDLDALLQTLADGVPRALGAFWFLHDMSGQYGSPLPVFLPADATLLGVAWVAALLRPGDVRGLILVLWAVSVLFIGGALTINPPFWPRIVIAFVPGAIAAAAAMSGFGRALRLALGRHGPAVLGLATVTLLGWIAHQHLGYFASFSRGIRPGQTTPTQSNQWVESLMGRDLQKWGAGAMIYIVAQNPDEHSCRRSTMSYYAAEADVQDAREIVRYVPFEDPRTIVCYFAPDSFPDMEIVRRRYPDAEERIFEDNLGRTVFARMVVRAPHS